MSFGDHQFLVDVANPIAAPFLGKAELRRQEAGGVGNLEALSLKPLELTEHLPQVQGVPV